jgi:hypothetical protein
MKAANRWLQELREMFRLPLLLLYAGVWLVLILMNPVGMDNYSVMAGLGLENGIDLLGLSQWLLMMATPLIGIGFYIVRQVSVAVLTVARLGSARAWVMRRVVMMLQNSLVYVVMGYILMLIMQGQADASSALAVLGHLCFLSMILMLIFVVKQNTAMSILIVLLGEGISYIVSQTEKTLNTLLPGNWGMVLRSDMHDPLGGFPFGVIMGLQIISICGMVFWLVKAAVKKEIYLLRRI